LKGKNTMENETAKIETPEQIREAVGLLAAEVVRAEEVTKALGTLTAAMDLRIRALTALVDHHHEVLTKLAGLPPRPKGDPNVN
jgi:hypothetical protein